MKHIYSLIISIILGVIGQISLKAGALESIKQGGNYFHQYTIVGLLTYFLASFFYIFSLQKIPLSVAFPSVSISYVVVSLIAHIIWGEYFGYRQIFALFLIGLGIYILSRN